METKDLWTEDCSCDLAEAQGSATGLVSCFEDNRGNIQVLEACEENESIVYVCVLLVWKEAVWELVSDIFSS